MQNDSIDLTDSEDIEKDTIQESMKEESEVSERGRSRDRPENFRRRRIDAGNHRKSKRSSRS